MARPVVAEDVADQDRLSSGVSFTISAQSLESALVAFSRQSDVQLLYDANLVTGRRSSAVSGRFPPLRAIRMLLRGTGLEVRHAGVGAITLARAARDSGYMALDTMTVAAPRRLGSDLVHHRYGALLQRRIAQELTHHRETAHGHYTVELHVWLDPDGKVRETRIAGLTGDQGRAPAISRAVSALTIAQPPPSSMPQPVRLRFDARPPL